MECEGSREGCSMMGSQVILVSLLTLVLMGFDFLGFAYHSWNEKMTVEVEVNGHLYSGSSVVEMSVFGHPEIPIIQAVGDLDMRGEAVVVELPESRYLFALLTYNTFWPGIFFKNPMLRP